MKQNIFIFFQNKIAGCCNKMYNNAGCVYRLYNITTGAISTVINLPDKTIFSIPPSLYLLYMTPQEILNLFYDVTHYYFTCNLVII